MKEVIIGYNVCSYAYKKIKISDDEYNLICEDKVWWQDFIKPKLNDENAGDIDEVIDLSKNAHIYDYNGNQVVIN